jgi:enoyl-CoA hydratase/carnithine racemase
MPAAGYRITWQGAIAEIRLEYGKANALNPRSLAAIDGALGEAARGNARGVVLTGYDRYFSAGLDLVTLYDLDRADLDAFVAEFDRVMLAVFTFPAPVVAAVNGHAVAGGGILAFASDARLMVAGDARIGLNEVRLGLPFPASALEIARRAVLPEWLDSVLYGGQLYTPDEALTRGLVDGLDAADVVAAARAFCERLAELPAEAFRTIKASLKAPAVRQAEAAGDELRRAFVDAWYSPDARRLVGEARSRLR